MDDMARPEVTGRKINKPKQKPPALAMTIPELCEAARISVAMFFKIKKQGFGPRETKFGARTVITMASANEWIRAREIASNKTTSVKAAKTVASAEA
jgi:hypothetical protein